MSRLLVIGVGRLLRSRSLSSRRGGGGRRGPSAGRLRGDVAERELRLQDRDEERAVVVDARHDEPGPVGERELLEKEAVEVRVRHLEVGAVERRGLAPEAPRQELLLDRRRDPERQLQRDHREDDARDAERVGDRVSERRERCGEGGGGGVPRHFAERLLGRGETRRVRRRSGEDADDGRKLDAEDEVGGGGEGDAREDDRGRQEVQLQAAAAERGDEPGADLQADRGDEEDQAEVSRELQDGRLDRDAEMPEKETDEEDAGRRQADASDLHGTEGEAETGDEGEDEGRRNGGKDHPPIVSRASRGVEKGPEQTFPAEGRIVPSWLECCPPAGSPPSSSPACRFSPLPPPPRPPGSSGPRTSVARRSSSRGKGTSSESPSRAAPPSG
jgi:hypothetical protein